MKINIVYTGNIITANERRDFMLMLKYALEANGHDVILSFCTFDERSLNIIIGGHNVAYSLLEDMLQHKLSYAVINTESITGDCLNYKPAKGAGDFHGTFIPLLQNAKFVWDVIPQNLEQYAQYGLNAQFLRWGYVPELKEIKHDKPKDLDYYYFGTMSDYSQQTIDALNKAGFKGIVHTGVPYFVRNTYIERAKVCLNLIKDPRFRHVNNFRICYLANNGVCTLAQLGSNTDDKAEYFKYTWPVTAQGLAEELAILTGLGKAYQAHGAIFKECFKMITAKDILGELLEKSL